METIKIHYKDNEMPRLEKISQGDWIDLRTSEDVDMRAGDFKLIDLGVAMVLPKGYEAHVLPRSSTYKKHSIIMGNMTGVVDNEYNGPADRWKFPAIALKDTHIDKYTRIAQFRIVENQPQIQFVETAPEEMGTNRGGIGSTGEK